MNDLLPAEEKKDAFSRILSFYTKDDIMLSAEEEGILKRWVHCDKLMLQRKFTTSQIIEKLVDLFGISKYTAQADIKQTHALFGQVRTLNKNYLLSHHIEDIQLQIERIKYDKSLAHLLPKLYAELTKAIASLPEDAGKKDVQIPNIVIGSVTVSNQPTAPTISFDEARQKWKQRKAKRTPDNYTDFEVVK